MSVPDVNLNAPLEVEKSAPVAENETVTKSLGWFFGGTVALVIMVVLAVVVGFFATRNQTSALKQQIQVVTPTPTPAPELTFEVLNGSGTRGVAAKFAGILTNGGKRVIVSGNANNSDYQGNHLFLVEGLAGQGTQIVEELNKLGIDAVLENAALTNSTASARLIIGK